MASTQTFLRTILKRIGLIVQVRAIRRLTSTTLRAALELHIHRDNTAVVHLPHYWSLYVHDGRGPFSMPPGRFMVWYKDIKDDPRLRGGQTPARLSRVRSLRRVLSKRKFRADVAAGKVVFVERITKATPGQFFFSNEPGGAQAGVTEEINVTASFQFRQHVKSQLKKLLNQKETALIRL